MGSASPLRPHLQHGLRRRRRHSSRDESRGKSRQDRRSVPQKYSHRRKTRRTQRHHLFRQSHGHVRRRRRQKHHPRPQKSEENRRRQRRNDLPRAAEQQSGSQGLHVRPHGVGRARDGRRQLAESKTSLRHLPHANHGR